MPEIGAVRELGAYGIILLVFVLGVWKGVPALKSWLDNLLVTFRTEIQNERAFAKELLAAEREDHRRDTEGSNRVIEANTAATKELKESVRELRETVQQLVDGHK